MGCRHRFNISCREIETVTSTHPRCGQRSIWSVKAVVAVDWSSCLAGPDGPPVSRHRCQRFTGFCYGLRNISVMSKLLGRCSGPLTSYPGHSVACAAPMDRLDWTHCCSRLRLCA